MSIQCGYHSWISVHHATQNSQTKTPNAIILGRLLEMYNLLGTYVSAELTDCRQNLALSSSCRSEKNSFGLRSIVTSLSWEYTGCKTSTNIIKRYFVSFVTSHALWIHIESQPDDRNGRNRGYEICFLVTSLPYCPPNPVSDEQMQSQQFQNHLRQPSLRQRNDTKVSKPRLNFSDPQHGCFLCIFAS